MELLGELLQSKLFTPLLAGVVLIASIYYAQKYGQRHTNEMLKRLLEENSSVREENRLQDDRLHNLELDNAVHKEKLTGLKHMLENKFGELSRMIERLNK